VQWAAVASNNLPRSRSSAAARTVPSLLTERHCEVDAAGVGRPVLGVQDCGYTVTWIRRWWGGRRSRSRRESGGHFVFVLGGNESVAAGSEVR
jgi:hypothetical protein